MVLGQTAEAAAIASVGVTRDNLRATTNVTIDFPSPGALQGTIGISLGVNFAQSANITFRGAKIDVV